MIDAAEAALARLADAHTELVGELPYDVEDEAVRHVKTVLVANKADADGAGDRLELVREWAGGRFPVVTASALKGEGLDGLRRASYDLLGVIRVYTKIPGKPADRTKPFTIPIGSTVRRPRQGDSPRLRAVAEVRQGLGYGRLRRADGQARPRASRRRRGRVARLVGSGRSFGRVSPVGHGPGGARRRDGRPPLPGAGAPRHGHGSDRRGSRGRGGAGRRGS